MFSELAKRNLERIAIALEKIAGLKEKELEFEAASKKEEFERLAESTRIIKETAERNNRSNEDAVSGLSELLTMLTKGE